MKAVTNLVYQLKNQSFAKKYPHAGMYDGKIHVLYVSAVLNGTGLYRSILPMLHLNKQPRHSAIVAQVHGWQGQMIDAMDINLNPALVQWADYVVMPTHVQGAAQMIADFRNINKKAHLQFVYDVDDNQDALHIMHPLFNHITKAMRAQRLADMAACDVVTGTNARLLQFYKDLLTQKHPTATPDFFMLPNLMSDFCYDDLYDQEIEAQRAALAPTVGPKNKKRIALTINPGQFVDVNPFRKILLDLQTQRNDYELMVIGWDGRDRKNFKNALKDVAFTHVPAVPVTEFTKLWRSLQLDMALMPLANNQFNLCKSNHKLLQYAWQGIPAIVSDIETYTDVIYPSDAVPITQCLNVPVAASNDDWLPRIHRMLDDDDRRQRQGAEAAQMVKMNYNLGINIDLWEQCFA